VLFGIYLSSVSVYSEQRAPLTVRSPFTPKFVLRTELRYKRAALWVLVDVLALAMAYYLGFLVRFGLTEEWAQYFALYTRTAPAAVAALLLGVLVQGLYRSDWQTFSFHEVKSIGSGVTLGTIVTAVVLVAGFGATARLWPVLAVCWGASVLMLSGSRGVIRAMADALRRPREAGERVFIYGAGTGGDLACRELRSNADLGRWPVAFIDDDPGKQGSTLNGLPVVGGLARLAPLARAWQVQEVVVATDKLSEDNEQALVALARRHDLLVSRIGVRLSAVDTLADLRRIVSEPGARARRG
jgi:UDP-GlcNAc:undecaprenyl-phosphate GlcNAc-1-phosphate transferase